MTTLFTLEPVKMTTKFYFYPSLGFSNTVSLQTMTTKINNRDEDDKEEEHEEEVPEDQNNDANNDKPAHLPRGTI